MIFVKEPRPGQVKTRLAREIGRIRAVWWHRQQCRSLIRRMSRDPRWETILAVTPDRLGLDSRFWPESLPRLAQGTGDLGDRMRRVMRYLPPGPVLIIGSDVPGASPIHVARAFRRLGSHDAVFGPSPDGGYWLVGLKRRSAVSSSIFAGVRWSSPHALEDSIRSLGNCSTGLVDSLRDVDTAEDMRLASR